MTCQIKIWSAFLLIIYIMLLGHDLIPHSHEELKENHVHGQSEDTHRHESEAHIAHANHCDLGVLDLLICVLSEVEHPATGEGNSDFCFIKANEFSFQNLKVKDLTLLTSFFSIWEPEKQVQTHFTEKPVFYSPPVFSCLRFRGPPVLIG